MGEEVDGEVFGLARGKGEVWRRGKGTVKSCTGKTLGRDDKVFAG